jgi:hypothetical protein
MGAVGSTRPMEEDLRNHSIEVVEASDWIVIVATGVSDIASTHFSCVESLSYAEAGPAN